jgi:hypothetical protein
LWVQEGRRDTLYHLFVTGDCRTEFVKRSVALTIPRRPTTLLYRLVTEQVNEGIREGSIPVNKVPESIWTTFTWWDLHRGVEAEKREWRLLIRVAESDYLPPLTDLNQVLRSQQQVYVNPEFGW